MENVNKNRLKTTVGRLIKSNRLMRTIRRWFARNCVLRKSNWIEHACLAKQKEKLQIVRCCLMTTRLVYRVLIFRRPIERRRLVRCFSCHRKCDKSLWYELNRYAYIIRTQRSCRISLKIPVDGITRTEPFTGFEMFLTQDQLTRANRVIKKVCRKPVDGCLRQLIVIF